MTNDQYVFENEELGGLYRELLGSLSDSVLFNREAWAKLVLPLRQGEFDVTYPLRDLEVIAKAIYPEVRQVDIVGPYANGGPGLSFVESPGNWCYIAYNGFIGHGFPDLHMVEQSYKAHVDRGVIEGPNGERHLGTLSWVYETEEFIKAVAEGRRENRYT